jgi:nucleoid DNA-binding protein
MTKQELIEQVHASQEEGLSKRATEDLLNIVFSTLKTAIKKDKKVRVPGFGQFSVRQRKARIARNPRTGDPVQVPASQTVGFKPSKLLRDAL